MRMIHLHRRRTRSRLVSALWPWLTLLLAVPALAAVPERTAAGTTLEIPDSELDAGLPYYLLTDDDAQVVVTSESELMKLGLTSSRVVGYLVAPFDLEEPEAAEKPILSGALRIPVATLEGGSRYSRSFVFGPQGLAADQHPEIAVELLSLNEPRRIEGGAGDEVFRFAFTARLAIGIKGESFELEAPVELAYHLSSQATMARYVGDMAVLTSSLELEPAQLGLEVPPPAAPLFASPFSVDLFLVFCTVPPDKTLDPAITQEQFHQEQRFVVLLRDLDDDVAAYAHAEAYAETVWDDAAALGRLATTVVLEPNVERRRLGFARRLAERAVELTGEKDAYQLNTLARIQFEQGDGAAALESQRKANGLVGDEDPNRSVFEANLKRYEAASGS